MLVIQVINRSILTRRMELEFVTDVMRLNETEFRNSLIMRDGLSMDEFNRTVKNMITSSQIILMRKDKEQTKRLRELWMETTLRLKDELR